MSQITEFKLDPRDGTATFERANGQVESFNLSNTVLRDPLTQRLVTPDGQAVGVALARPSGIYARKPYGTLSFEPLGSSVHQLRTYVPFGNMLVDVQLEVYNDQTAANVTLNKHAVAGGSDYTAQNPSGAWAVGPENLPLNGDASYSSATPGRLITAPLRIYMPPDVVDPRWSTLYSRTQQTGTRGYGANVASNWNNVATLFRQTMDFQTLAAIDAEMTPSGSNVRFRSHSLILRPVGALTARTSVVIGDSRSSGQGAGDTDGSSFPGCFGWHARAIESISGEFGDLVGYENWGRPGTNSTAFLTVFNDVLRYRAPDHIHYQGISSNDTNPWTEATVNTAITRLANVAAECRRRGIAFTTETMYPSVAVTNETRLAQWLRWNQHVRDTYPGRYIEFAQSPLADYSTELPSLAVAYRVDAQHRNDAGHTLSAQIAVPVIKQALGLT